jgi:3-oxoacyl-[acyl-carrier protein] reductase
MENNGRVALVTGGAGSLGLQIVKALAASGHTVALLDRDSLVHDEAEKLAVEGASVRSYQVELSDREAVRDFIPEFLSVFERCDVLVNNAGINLDNPDGTKFYLEQVTDQPWDLMLNVNLRAPFDLCRAFVPGMKKAGWGRIVNVASRAGRTYVPASNVHYSASKAGLIGMTRMIAGEVGPFGITANCIAPGRISSPLADSQSPEILAESLKNIPLNRVGSPREIGATVDFLASEGAGYITGHTLDVNGGAFMA